MTKTVLVPSAPWPDQNVVAKKQHTEKRPTITRSGWRKVQIKNEIENLDYFAETHDELLNPKKGSGNPNAAKNFEKFNLRSL
jgi:hypothetical protein